MSERIDLDVDGNVDDVVLDPKRCIGIHMEDLGSCFWICFERTDGDRMVFEVPLSDKRKSRTQLTESSIGSPADTPTNPLPEDVEKDCDTIGRGILNVSTRAEKDAAYQALARIRTALTTSQQEVADLEAGIAAQDAVLTQQINEARAGWRKWEAVARKLAEVVHDFDAATCRGQKNHAPVESADEWLAWAQSEVERDGQ